MAFGAGADVPFVVDGSRDGLLRDFGDASDIIDGYALFHNDGGFVIVVMRAGL